MDDDDILARIDELVRQEHELHERAQAEDGLDAGDELLLRDLGVERDQCWDLLRQRRARRDAGQDPDAVEVRSETTVESFLQ